ncbi:unnamed protein product [Urochloa decumbens]|uniref:KIB1-4 beta-propeller domain-containing protein n=1 Tax=Urochloa decumbens TaxID=240449 RepID=A0ABC9G2R9_9POAL
MHIFQYRTLFSRPFHRVTLSGLPPELLEYIAKRLASGADAASFRAVCTPWRDAVPFASCFAPLLLLPFLGPDDADRVTLYSVGEDKHFTLPLPPGAARGWVALIFESGSVALLNPFTGARVELPPASEYVAAASSMLVSKDSGGGRWLLHPDDGGVVGYGSAATAGAASAIAADEMRQVFFHNVVLSSPPDAGGGGGRGCVAVAVLAGSTEVASTPSVGWGLGVDTAWTLLETYLDCSVDSVVFCQDRFFAIDCTGEVSMSSAIAAGHGVPTAAPVPSLSPPDQLCHRSYLEWNGELYVVGAMVDVFRSAQRFEYSSVVYKCSNLLDATPPAWSRVNDAGDLTLFVSIHCRHSFAGTSVSSFERNSVYFSEPLYEDHRDPAHRLEIADIATGASEVKPPFHQKVQDFEALGWIRPNLWRGRYVKL